MTKLEMLLRKAFSLERDAFSPTRRISRQETEEIIAQHVEASDKFQKEFKKSNIRDIVILEIAIKKERSLNAFYTQFLS